MRQVSVITATKRLAMGRLDALHLDRVMTWMGTIDREAILTDDEMARAVLRATCPRT